LAEVDAFPAVRRDFDRFQPEPLQGLLGHIEAR
jgi:hypothetical protein